jgi:hypothetical protein
MSEEFVSGSAPAEATPSAPSTPVTATPVTSAPAVATPQAPPQAPATGVSSEDRSNWVPPHRIRETREAALRQANEQFAQRESQMRAEAERYRQQVLALTGVTPPPNPEIKAVKDQFAHLYPGLAKMDEKG